ncbi:hypothetical protein TNCV_3054771 [Trichonephila clavipes]|nr:hypothetical protein TNCV_3054771 [Trichonephila clavipes]
MKKNTLTGKKSQHQERFVLNKFVFIHLKDDIDSNFVLKLQPIVLSFMNSMQGRVFQPDTARSHTAVVTQRALQCWHATLACEITRSDSN